MRKKFGVTSHCVIIELKVAHNFNKLCTTFNERIKKFKIALELFDSFRKK